MNSFLTGAESRVFQARTGEQAEKDTGTRKWVAMERVEGGLATAEVQDDAWWNGREKLQPKVEAD